MLRAALSITIFGASHSLQAQQLTSISYPSSSNESTNLNLPVVSLATASFSADELPDSPGTLLQSQTPQTTAPPAVVQTTNPDAVSPNGNQQTKRVLGLVPNFRSVSADIKLPPMSPKDKFIVAGKDTFDYSALFVAGVQAGFAMNSDSYPEFHQGAAGYARYYWHTLADMTSENFFVGGLGPIVFKQDNRYYTLGHGSFRKRTFYAVTRVLVTRKDDGDETFNFSEIIGSGAASGLSTLWYPKQYQTWTKVGQKWLTSDLIDCFNFWWKEWWPTANKYVFHTH
ncbi:MAG TPA: hypothetical protein VH117_09275 [Edaphobacter sp.]|jgi:hypothetical protein|nr:hypothetical protein [Edaphobacter sp.]